MNIEVILFDLDGVLVEAKEWHYRAVNKALELVCNYSIPYEEHLKTFDGLPTKVKLRILEEKGLVKASDFDEIFRVKQKCTIEVIQERCKSDNIKIEMMKGLSQYRKVCVTNSIHQTAYEMIVRSGLNPYLEFVQSNEATKFGKPNPSPYLLAMSRMGVCPKNSVIVEDSEKGIRSAKASGAFVMEVKDCEDVTLMSVENFIRSLPC